LNADSFMPWDLPGRADLLRRVVEAVRAESQRSGLIRDLLSKLTPGNGSWIAMLLARLLRAKATWNAHGPAIVEAFIEHGEPVSLWFLVMGLIADPEETPEDLAQRMRPLVPAIHTAFAQGVLLFLQKHGDRLGPKGVQCGLTAVGLLDPPRFFTRDIHRFKKTQRLDDDALRAADLIHDIANAGGSSDADLNGVAQCVQELKALVALQRGSCS